MNPQAVLHAIACLTTGAPSIAQRATLLEPVTTLLEALQLPIEHAPRLVGYNVKAFYPPPKIAGEAPRLGPRAPFIELEWLDENIDDFIVTTIDLAAEELGLRPSDVRVRLSMNKGQFTFKTAFPWGQAPGRYGALMSRVRIGRLDVPPDPAHRDQLYAAALAHRDAALARRASAQPQRPTRRAASRATR